MVQTFEVAGMDAIFSDKADSVYCWTVNGLEHFVAAETDEKYQFRPAGTYAVARLRALPGNWAFSDHGMLVIAAGGETPDERGLRFVRLPQKGQ